MLLLLIDNGNGLRIKEQERSNGGQSAPIASTHGNMVKGHHLLLSNHHGQLANNTPVHSQTLAGLSVEGDNTMDGQRYVNSIFNVNYLTIINLIFLLPFSFQSRFFLFAMKNSLN